MYGPRNTLITYPQENTNNPLSEQENNNTQGLRGHLCTLKRPRSHAVGRRAQTEDEKEDLSLS